MTGPAPHRLDLTGVRDKAGLLRSCAEQLGFPDGFGHNWDALDDCLRDLSWWGEPGADGWTVEVTGWGELRRRAPELARTLAEIFADAGTYWRERGVPLTVTLG
ncbi:barstar family protein [Streptomyces carpaticus]|uniref:Barstar family protein n=1 Tax=Streptomyces carpaticus TaxID=285558 RepID=A0ABV4ZUI1_9ACTN